MTAPEDRCSSRTAAGTTCKRPGYWIVPGVAGFHCKPHATRLATSDEGDYLILHSHGGRSEEVSPPARTPRADTRRIPIGLDAIVEQLADVQTRPQLDRVRWAVINQIHDLIDSRGLKWSLSEALRAAKTRVARHEQHATGGTR